MRARKCANIARMIEQAPQAPRQSYHRRKRNRKRSRRRRDPCGVSPPCETVIKVSCAAFPETLLEAELFGYEKGRVHRRNARKEGRFELADGGTIFLDEIGEISPGVQVKLLRVLQDGKFERLGGTRTIDADVRILAATNKDLQEEVEEKRFREDLFYRLNVINIRIPALRERKEDIQLLAMHFLKSMRIRIEAIEGFSEDAMLA